MDTTLGLIAKNCTQIHTFIMTAALLLLLVYLSVTSYLISTTSCYSVNRNYTKSANVNLTQTSSARKTNQKVINKDGDFEFYYKMIEKLGNTIPAPAAENFTTLISSTNATISTSTEDPVFGLNATDNPRARIIGGEPANVGEFKYQLRINFFSRHHCGASLILVEEEQLAITAAHCVREAQPEDLVLVAGDLMRSQRSGNEQERKVVDIVRHENFEFIEGVPSYDIALLFIEKPFDENNFVQSIPLPKANQQTTGKVLVSGWGDDNPRFTGRPSDRLMKVEVPVVEYNKCKQAYSFIIDEFYDHFFCAGYMQTGIYKDSCQGDSGGPVKSVDGNYLAGVISWGAGCGVPSFPGVNTKVAYFVDWINDQVRKYKTDGSSEEDDSSREEEEEGEYEDNTGTKTKARR